MAMPETDNPTPTEKPVRTPRAVSRGPKAPLAYRRRNFGAPPLAETPGPKPDDDISQIKLQVAVIERPHGVQGEIRARITTDTPDRLIKLKSIFLGNEKFARRVLGARYHQDRILFKLEGIATPEAVKALSGTPLRIMGSQAAPLAEGEYFIFQLIDNEVVDEAGTVIGTLIDIMETGANEVYVVSRGDDTPDLLLPNIPSVVLNIDTAAKRITVRPDEFL
jgi:16S rRNA processing protein RimM